MKSNLELLTKLLPIYLVFGIGYFSKRKGILTSEDANTIFRLTFHLAAPSLIIVSLAKTVIDASLLLIPLIALLVALATYFIALGVSQLLTLTQSTKGTFLIAAVIMNTSFMYPFILAVYETKGFSQAIMFDLGNALVIFTFAYYIACKHGNERLNRRQMLAKLVANPPLWGITIGCVLSYTNATLPSPLQTSLEMIGSLTIPLLLLSLGVVFEPRITRPKILFSALTCRIAVGGLAGLLISKIFGISEISTKVAILCAAAPPGYNTLMFSSLVGLDTELASSIVSISLLAAIAYVPFLIWLLGGL